MLNLLFNGKPKRNIGIESLKNYESKDKESYNRWKPNNSPVKQKNK